MKHIPKAALGAGIGWVYWHPPLDIGGVQVRNDGKGNILAFSVGLENQGPWPLALTAVTFKGSKVGYPQVIGVANLTDGLLAGSAAVHLNEFGHLLETGPDILACR